MKFFTDHPKSVGETYFQHMGSAFSFSGKMLVAGVACCVHGVFPFLFTTTGRETVEDLHSRMVLHRHRDSQAQLKAKTVKDPVRRAA
ncbi:MAG: DUF6356 family protein [Pseudomonadota bacterium]